MVSEPPIDHTLLMVAQDPNVERGWSMAGERSGFDSWVRGAKGKLASSTALG